MDPAHGPPLQARVAAANRTVLQLANMLVQTNGDPGAHGHEQGKAKQTGRGQTVEKGSGHDMAKGGQAHSLLNKALQANTAGRFSARHRPQNKRTAHSWPALQQKQQLPDVIRTLAVQCR